jgi:hypothetical protein
MVILRSEGRQTLGVHLDVTCDIIRNNGKRGK